MEILNLVFSDYDELVQKSVTHQILQRDEGGFFSKVYSLHFGKKNHKIKLSDNNLLYQIGWRLFNLDFNSKIYKYFGVVAIAFKILAFLIIIKKSKISVIRAQDPYIMGLIGLFYAKIFKIPLVVSINSDYDKSYEIGGSQLSFTIFGSRKYAKILEHFILKRANLILPFREHIKKGLLKNFSDLDVNKIKIFPIGVSFDNFDQYEVIDIKKLFNISSDKKVLSFVGRLSKENYIYDMVEAVKVISNRNDFVLLIVGDGTQREIFKTLIDNYSLNDKILMVGFQEQNIVANVRKASDICLALMGGNSLIESCAAYKPIIAYDVEWHYELVKNNQTGFLIEEHDIQSLATSIKYLLDNPEIAKKYGLEARKLAFANNNLRFTTPLKQNIYANLLNV